MEHFRNAKVVRLLSRHNKYLTADDDGDDGVRQHRSGAGREARWVVELVEGKTDVIRLKSYCYNRYLAASDKRFLLGATGKKVLLASLPPRGRPESLGESVEWQPVRDGYRSIKLRTKAGTFLRANGFVKPYGNTLTHGNPHRTVTQDWVLWEVDVIEMAHDAVVDSSVTSAADSALSSPSVSFSSYPATASAVVPMRSMREQGQSAAFNAARMLAAAASVTADRSRRSTKSDVSMASSCVSDEADVESPYTNSPRSTSVVDSPARPPPTRLSASSLNTRHAPIVDEMQTSDDEDDGSTVSSSPPRPPARTALPSPKVSPALSRKESSHEGRVIYYYFADDDGEIDNTFDSGYFKFYGSNPLDVIHSVEKETGVDGFILCKRNVLNDKLYRINTNLSLPPDREPMTVFIVHPMSQVASRIL